MNKTEKRMLILVAVLAMLVVAVSLIWIPLLFESTRPVVKKLNALIDEWVITPPAPARNIYPESWQGATVIIGEPIIYTYGSVRGNAVAYIPLPGDSINEEQNERIAALEERIDALERDNQDNHGNIEIPNLQGRLVEGSMEPIYPTCIQENLEETTCTMAVPRGTTLW